MGNFRVGTGVRDITPPAVWLQAGRIWLWGYGSRSQPCSAVLLPISARALAIEDAEGRCIVLVAVDIGALDPAMTQRIRTRIGQSHGIGPECICINVSHTHSAPVTAPIPTWQPGVDIPDTGYVQLLEQRIVEAVDDALTGRQSASISFGRGATATSADRHFVPRRHDDPTLDVIRVTSDAGDIVAIVFSMACHPTCLGASEEIHADFPGIARNRIESQVGGVALFLQGYAGICGPGAGFGVEQLGNTLAQDVLAVLSGTMQELEGAVDAWLTSIELPFQPLPSADVIDSAAASGGLYARWANHMTAMGSATPASLSTPLQALRVGRSPVEWYVAASAHEVSTDFGKKVRNIWPYPRVTTLGYSNSQLSYLPSDEVLQNPSCVGFPFLCGNYEGGEAFVWYGHRGPLALGVDQRFHDGHVALLDHGWQRIGHATQVTAMTAWQGQLFATTSNSKLWWRNPVAHDVVWNHMGHAIAVVGLAALDGKLFCATSDGKLWWRFPDRIDLPWQHIGHATSVTAMTAYDGKLFATTSNNKLWRRDPIEQDVPWEWMGHAVGVVGLAVCRDKLIAATSDHNLHWRDPDGKDIPWHRFGHAQHVVAMAAIGNMLFAATQQGVLWRREV